MPRDLQTFWRKFLTLRRQSRPENSRNLFATPEPSSRVRRQDFSFAKFLGTSIAHVLILVLVTNSIAQTSAPPSSIQFSNVTKQAGIKFVHYRGNQGIAIIREVFSPGLCVADFDGDGY